jgi:DNA modification methylase
MSFILEGDCIKVMKEMEEKSIDLIITSPPYFQQRDYGMENEIGKEEKVDDYLLIMKEWAKECLRVLKDTGSLFLNIGDKYEKKGLLMIPEQICLSMINNGWTLRNKIVWYKPNHMPTSIKDRFCSSWEPIYFFTKNSGKYYQQEYYSNLDLLRETPQTIIKNPFPKTLSIEEYEKKEKEIEEWNTLKINKNSKLRNAGINKGSSPGARKEIIYSKMRKHVLKDEEEIEIHLYLKESVKRKKLNAKKLDDIFQYKSKAGHWLRIDHGRSLPSVSDYKKLKEILELDDRYDYILEEHYVLQSVQNNSKGKTPEDMWSINLKHEKIEHYAMFPIELPLKIISAFCPPNGIILDPFGGSGTTGLAAKQLGYNFILIELNPEFVKMIKERLFNNKIE